MRQAGSLKILHITRPKPQIIPRYNHTGTKDPDHSASAKLFADAAREEAESSQPKSPTRIPFLENEHENWTGDERIQDAVLRMLVDKYKPLRSGTILSAEQKLKLAPPRIPLPNVEGQTHKFAVPSTGSWATEPLLPSTPGHQPWHTEYKPPSHAVSSIKQGYFPPLPARPSLDSHPVDDAARRKEKEAKKKAEHVGRLTRAKESTLDYRLGIKNRTHRPNPVTLKGWASLVEDRIEKARRAGLFKTVKGQGQPIQRHHEESNPFIAREEFLMNRIVQRNGAAPPWVEVQTELATATQTFRQILQQSWVRRATRLLTAANPPGLLHTISLADIKSLRDPDWEKREQSYHDAAIEELNSLVRKYNGLAPYSVRRPYYSRSVEIGRLFEACAEDIQRELVERARDTVAPLGNDVQLGMETGKTADIQVTSSKTDRIQRIRDVFMPWLKRLISKWGLK